MSVEKDIVSCLTDDLRRAPYKGHRNPLRGHCYVASEALYHLKGGKRAGLKPMFISHEGAPHWFLADTKNNVYIDLTSGQFETPVPYHLAKGKGFLTAKPSARAAQVMRRVQGGTFTRDPERAMDRSTNTTVVEYAVRTMMKGKSPSVAAKDTAKKFSGFENMFFGPGVSYIDPQKLEEALWERLSEFTMVATTKMRPGMEHFALDGTVSYFRQAPAIRKKLKAKIIALAGGVDPFPNDGR